MKKTNDNVCKFVSYTNTKQIITTNFVYECNLEKTGKPQVKKNNAIYLVVSGKGKLYTSLFEKELSSGMLFFTFSNESYRIDNNDNLHFIYITFNGIRADELFERFKISPANRIFEGYEGMISFWQSCLSKANEKNLDLISESVLLYAFSQLYLIREEEKYLLDDILKHIEENFTNSNYSLASVSKALGYSSKYISRIFSKNSDTTFSQYVKTLRLNHAIFLMEQGITSIKSISYLSGYRDPLYFSNVFKTSVGLSPSEYITRISKNAPKQP